MSKKKNFAEKRAERLAKTPLACICVFDNERDYKKWSGCTKPFKEWSEGLMETLKAGASTATIIPVVFNEQSYLDYIEAKGLTDSRKTKSDWAAWALLSHSPLTDQFVMADKLNRDQRLYERVL